MSEIGNFGTVVVGAALAGGVAGAVGSEALANAGTDPDTSDRWRKGFDVGLAGLGAVVLSVSPIGIGVGTGREGLIVAGAALMALGGGAFVGGAHVRLSNDPD